MKKARIIMAGMVVLLLLLVAGLIGHQYISHRRKMLEARDEVLPILRARAESMHIETRRPLRGEGLPGSGAAKLLAVLEEIRNLQDPLGIPDLKTLREEFAPPNIPEDGTEARKTYEALREFLPGVREALQHESCRLEIYVEEGIHVMQGSAEWNRLVSIQAVGFALLIEAMEMCERGERSRALEAIADTFRLAQDVGGSGPTILRLMVMNRVRKAAVPTAAHLLAAYPFTQVELRAFGEELDTLLQTEPSYLRALELEEMLIIVSMAEEFEGGRSVHMQTGRDWWLAFARGGLDVVRYREVWRKMRDVYAKPVVQMRTADDQLRKDLAGEAELLDDVTFDLSSIRDMELEAVAGLRCLRAAVQMHLWAAENGGEFPPEASAPGELPMDPWGAGPLRYRPASGGKPPAVYSVGRDLQDDRGLAPGSFYRGDRSKGTDYVFPLAKEPQGDSR